MRGLDRSPTKADNPVDEAALGKYYLPFVAASQRHHAVAVIDHRGITEGSLRLPDISLASRSSSPVQDIALSRRQHGFKSRTGRHSISVINLVVFCALTFCAFPVESRV
jgi:hypothetical protein